MIGKTVTTCNVRGISEPEALHKVWKHLYNEHEAWERICPNFNEGMRIETEQTLGVVRAVMDRLPNGWERARGLLTKHNLSAYMPTYLEQLFDSETRWGTSDRDASKVNVLTSSGIFIVLDCAKSRHDVITAFRPTPPLKEVVPPERVIHKWANEYFNRNIPMNAQQIVDECRDRLARVGQPPTDVSDLFLLVSSIGYGRLLRNHSSVAAVLEAPETTFQATETSLREELIEKIDWEGVIEGLSTAIEEANLEDFEWFLSQAEEMLAVAEVLHINAAAENFCEEVERILAWIPAEWSNVGVRAEIFLGVMYSKSTFFERMLLDLVASIDRARASDLDPVELPAASIVEEVLRNLELKSTGEGALGKPQPIHSDRSVSLTAGLRLKFSQFFNDILDSLKFETPIPQMGADLATQGVCKVEFSLSVSSPPVGFVAFVVDEEYPEGYDVSDALTHGDGKFWELAVDQRADLIVFASDVQIPKLNLADICAFASNRHDIARRDFELSAYPRDEG